MQEQQRLPLEGQHAQPKLATPPGRITQVGLLPGLTLRSHSLERAHVVVAKHARDAAPYLAAERPPFQDGLASIVSGEGHPGLVQQPDTTIWPEPNHTAGL